MPTSHNPIENNGLHRRQLFGRLGSGLSAVASAGLLAQSELVPANVAHAAGTANAPQPHFAPRAKRVIHLFMNGGPFQKQSRSRRSWSSRKRMANRWCRQKQLIGQRE